MKKEGGRPSRFAALLRLLRTAPDERGAGIARTLVLSVVVGVCAGLGAVLLASLLDLFNWLFLGQIAGTELGYRLGDLITGEKSRYQLSITPNEVALNICL